MSQRSLNPVEAQIWLRVLYRLGYTAGRATADELDALAAQVEPHMVAITDAVNEFRRRVPSG